MNYALNLADDGRILSATYPQFAPEDAVKVEALPEGEDVNIADYRYQDGEFIYDPLPVEEVEETPSPQDDTDAMLIDHEYRLTMLELGLSE
jgi:hypothetical protein